MAGAISLLYGLVLYPIFLSTFLYVAAFSGNLSVSKTIDSGVVGRRRAS